MEESNGCLNKTSLWVGIIGTTICTLIAVLTYIGYNPFKNDKNQSVAINNTNDYNKPDKNTSIDSGSPDCTIEDINDNPITTEYSLQKMHYYEYFLIPFMKTKRAKYKDPAPESVGLIYIILGLGGFTGFIFLIDPIRLMWEDDGLKGKIIMSLLVLLCFIFMYMLFYILFIFKQ